MYPYPIGILYMFEQNRENNYKPFILPSIFWLQILTSFDHLQRLQKIGKLARKICHTSGLVWPPSTLPLRVSCEMLSLSDTMWHPKKDLSSWGSDHTTKVLSWKQRRPSSHPGKSAGGKSVVMSKKECFLSVVNIAAWHLVEPGLDPWTQRRFNTIRSWTGSFTSHQQVWL